MNPVQFALNDQQREAVLHTEGPLIVIAGAGSGKTKMLTARISHLIQSCRISPHKILAVTFTNKAAAEMRERVETILGYSLAKSWSSDSVSLGSPEIGTFHSVCVRILRRESVRTAITKPFVIYDDSDQLSLIKSSLHALQIDDKAFNPKSIQGVINKAKCDALEPHEIEVAPHDIFARQSRRVYEHYQKALIANNALDFGEIICTTYRLLRDHADLREKYQKRYRYIHVDEYQDTNRSQYLLLSILAKGSEGGHQNICVVGDEDQSIYKWRGADISNILDFEKDYPGAKVVKLEQNYRSTKTILAVSGSVIKNNRTRKDKTLWTDHEEGSLVIRAQLADERAEAEMVVSEVKRLAANEGRSYNDFAIFYRTNAQSRSFEDVLRREKVSYQVVGGLRFYDRKEIKDILSYFKVILNPADSVSLKRILNVPTRGIGKTTLQKLEDFHGTVNSEHSFTFWDVLEKAAAEASLTSAGTAKKLAQFTRLMQKLMADQPKLLLSELYHLILDETGYVSELRNEGTEESLSRIQNLEEFNTLLQEFETDQLESFSDLEREKRKLLLLPTFIEQSALASEVNSPGSQSGGQTDGQNPSAVKLMTLHSSKGLEFPVVFMVGMEEGLFPSIKAWEEAPEEDIEEERRLCYVGMTRAREVLYLMNVIIRRIWGNVSYQQPSRFFTEIPDEFLEFRDFSVGTKATEYRTGSSRQLGYGQASQVARAPGISASDDWVGRQMIHPDYGRGTVTASEGAGTDQKVTIQFQGRDQKKFLLRYVSSYFG